MKKTLYDKIWDSHIVVDKPKQTSIIYIDMHLVHEVTSPQAFEGLKLTSRKVRHPRKAIATMDHNVPTRNRDKIADPVSRLQVETLRNNCHANEVTLYDINDINQGIVHVIAPEKGYTLPGMTIVCGDSHTATHGAFGALAFGIGTSEVEHVLATQTLQQNKSKNMKVEFQGQLKKGITAKDMILCLIGKIGTSGGTGYVFEFCGEAVSELSMEGRMTMCNMSIEGGARAGLIAPDETAFKYLQRCPFAPKDAMWEQAVEYWKTLNSDDGAEFDEHIIINAGEIEPQITWGTSPGQVSGVNAVVPSPDDFSNENERKACTSALEYMGVKPGTKLTEIDLDYVFLGSCTNSRIEDLRAASKIVKNKKVNSNLSAIVVPGSGLVKKQAEEEGLDKIFKEAGFEWREAGCSMCLSMNDDYLMPGQRCASTSNRNFEGRQGKGGRTHLVSPIMAAAAAINGHFVDIRELNI